MKKGLLMMMAALMVAVGANAQYFRTANCAKWLDMPLNVKTEKVMKTDYKPRSTSKSITHRRASEGTIDGTYILNADNYDGTFTESSTFTVTSQTGTITLDQYDENPSFDYNVVLNDFSYTGAVVYGNYDAEQGIISIPMQTIYTHSTYKEIVISGGYRLGTDRVGYGKAIYLIVNEDGSMDIDEDVEEEDDDATIGWVSFLPNYEDGGLWNYGFDIQVLVPNATITYNTTGKMFGGTGEGWTKNVQKRVNIADYGSEWAVSNFLGITTVSITMNEDGTCAMPFGGIAYDYEQDEPYGYYRFVGVSDAGEGYITRNYEKTSFNGFWKDGYALFGKLEYKEAWTDEDGDHEAGNYYVFDDDNYFPYMCVATSNDSDGAAYVLGYVAYMEIEKDDESGTSISTVTVGGKSVPAKTYNLMGQEVNAAAKGLVIRDGKKMLVK